jgi:hypothetical protein
MRAFWITNANIISYSTGMFALPDSWMLHQRQRDIALGICRQTVKNLPRSKASQWVISLLSRGGKYCLMLIHSDGMTFSPSKIDYLLVDAKKVIKL